uniref:Replication protein 1a n=1 Tax=Bemisia tabaci bromo-like virus 6 TaxID=2840006 RepID=A0A8E8FV11_9BROM|nr:polyprotein [Bemisia tabaci bromo-like virus 6]
MRHKVKVKLTESEKTILEQSFPELTLDYPKEVAFASHPLAAAFRSCEHAVLYGRLPADDTVVDIGGNLATHLHAGRFNVHVESPILDVRDAARATMSKNLVRDYVEASRPAMKYLDTGLKEFWKAEWNRYSSTPSAFTLKPRLSFEQFRDTVSTRTGLPINFSGTQAVVDHINSHMHCTRRSEDCVVPARYAMAVHSVYDIGVAKLATIMSRHNTEVLVGSFIYHPHVLIYPNGRIPTLGVRFQSDESRNTISFAFENDHSLAYEHSLAVYKSLLQCRAVETATDTYLYELQENRNGVQFFRMVRATAPTTLSTHIIGRTWFPELEFLVGVPVLTFGSDTTILDPSVRDVVWVHRDFYDYVKKFALANTNDSKALQRIFATIRNFSGQITIAGSVVKAKESLSADDAMRVAFTIYIQTHIMKLQLQTTTALMMTSIAEHFAYAHESYTTLLWRLCTGGNRLSYFERLHAGLAAYLRANADNPHRFVNVFREPYIEYDQWFSNTVVDPQPQRVIQPRPTTTRTDHVELRTLLQARLALRSTTGSSLPQLLARFLNAYPIFLIYNDAYIKFLVERTDDLSPDAPIIDQLFPTSFDALNNFRRANRPARDDRITPNTPQIISAPTPEDTPTQPDLGPTTTVAVNPDVVQPLDPKPPNTTTMTVDRPDPTVYGIYHDSTDPTSAATRMSLYFPDLDNTCEMDALLRTMEARDDEQLLALSAHVETYEQLPNHLAAMLVYDARNTKRMAASIIAQYLAINNTSSDADAVIAKREAETIWDLEGVFVLRRDADGYYQRDSKHTLGERNVLLDPESNELVTFDTSPRGVRLHNHELSPRKLIACPDRGFQYLPAVRQALAATAISTYHPGFEFLEGVPGCGKTTKVYSLIRDHTLVIVPTTALRDEYRKHLATREYIHTDVYTPDGYVLNRKNDSTDCYKRVLFDEYMLLNPAMVATLIALAKPLEPITLVGDRNQIPYSARLPGFHDVDWNVIRSRGVATYLNVSHRVPQDIARFFAATYEAGFLTTNPTLNSVHTHRLVYTRAAVAEAVARCVAHDPSTMFLTFTQPEKTMLRRFTNSVHTIHEVQGATFSSVALFRLIASDNAIYTSRAHLLVGLTRHKHTFDYYTVKPNHELNILVDETTSVSGRHTLERNYRTALTAPLPSAPAHPRPNDTTGVLSLDLRDHIESQEPPAPKVTYLDGLTFDDYELLSAELSAPADINTGLNDRTSAAAAACYDAALTYSARLARLTDDAVNTARANWVILTILPICYVLCNGLTNRLSSLVTLITTLSARITTLDRNYLVVPYVLLLLVRRTLPPHIRDRISFISAAVIGSILALVNNVDPATVLFGFLLTTVTATSTCPLPTDLPMIELFEYDVFAHCLSTVVTSIVYVWLLQPDVYTRVILLQSRIERHVTYATPDYSAGRLTRKIHTLSIVPHKLRARLLELFLEHFDVQDTDPVSNGEYGWSETLDDTTIDLPSHPAPLLAVKMALDARYEQLFDADSPDPEYQQNTILSDVVLDGPARRVNIARADTVATSLTERRPRLVSSIGTYQPALRLPTLPELYDSLHKRNWYPPVTANPISTALVERTANIFFSTFFSQRTQRHVAHTTTNTYRWITRLPLHKLKKTIAEFDPEQLSLINEYTLSLKPEPKNSLEGYAEIDSMALHNIVFHHSTLNAYFSPVFSSCFDALLADLKPNVIVYDRQSPAQVEARLNTLLTIGNRYKYIEFDFSKYDKSQLHHTYALEQTILTAVGLDQLIAARWYSGHVATSLRNFDTGLVTDVAYQRKTGDSSTTLGNTLINMAVISEVLADAGLPAPVAALFLGDDSLLVYEDDTDITTLTPKSVTDITVRYNLMVKMRVSNTGYMCSRLVVPTSTGFYLIPDPLKRMMRLGRDADTWTILHERLTSMRSELQPLLHSHIFDAAVDAVEARYGYADHTRAGISGLLTIIFDDPTDWYQSFQQTD